MAWRSGNGSIQKLKWGKQKAEINFSFPHFSFQLFSSLAGFGTGITYTRKITGSGGVC